MIPDWETERRTMVDRQLRRRGIRDERVLRAMSEIPREEFVPSELRVMAYGDAPVQIGYGQTISQPYMTALMAQELALTGSETVLEVGAGCGYAAAVLGELAARVVSVELLAPLARLAYRNLERAGRGRNVTIVQGDGSLGRPAFAPYDAISVAAAAPEIPRALIEQLKDSGRLVIPVGSLDNQELRVAVKRGGRMEYRVTTLCQFVPLRGAEGCGAELRLRTAKDRLKVEHSIIEGVRAMLEELLRANPGIRSVIPGVIRPVRDAKGKVRVRITVPVQNGWKAIALSAGARQELFVSTAMTRQDLEQAFEKAGALLD